MADTDMEIDNPVSEIELAAILKEINPDIDNLFDNSPSPQALFPSQDSTTSPTTQTQQIL